MYFNKGQLFYGITTSSNYLERILPFLMLKLATCLLTFMFHLKVLVNVNQSIKIKTFP